LAAAHQVKHGHLCPCNEERGALSYDALNRLTNVALCTAGASPCNATTANRLNNYAYTLSPAGNRTSVTELSGRAVGYGYDDIYRLTLTCPPYSAHS
jgi:hypothetical protein